MHSKCQSQSRCAHISNPDFCVKNLQLNEGLGKLQLQLTMQFQKVFYVCCVYCLPLNENYQFIDNLISLFTLAFYIPTTKETGAKWSWETNESFAGNDRRSRKDGFFLPSSRSVDTWGVPGKKIECPRWQIAKTSLQRFQFAIFNHGA